uniref:Uncharacterized protein n=1 Tax=Panagrolaimus superbus TaxID=310955 RepID=A0A914YAW4_9BILA
MELNNEGFIKYEVEEIFIKPEPSDPEKDMLTRIEKDPESLNGTCPDNPKGLPKASSDDDSSVDDSSVDDSSDDDLSDDELNTKSNGSKGQGGILKTIALFTIIFIFAGWLQKF